MALRIRVDEQPAATSASPRGSKRRRSEEANGCAGTPTFLDKTYALLEACPEELAGWTPRGQSFVVKRPDAFAEQVLPAYFKHNKFASFVRQLNLYGFRKVRGLDSPSPDADRVKSERSNSSGDDNATEDTRGWWEFRHDKFVRGQREQLRAIKRRATGSDSRPSPPADGQAPTVDRAEFDALKAEMQFMREQVQQLNKNMVTVLQALTGRQHAHEADRGARPPTAPAPPVSSSFAPSGGGINKSQLPPVVPQQQQQPLSIYAPPPQSLTISTSAQGLTLSSPSTQFPSPRHDIKTMRSPVGTYHLRPLQSLIHASTSTGGPGTPVGIPPLPSPRPSPMPSLVSPRLAFLSHAASTIPPVSTPDSRSSTHLEYVRQQQRYGQPSPVPSVASPDVAVRQLSQMAAQTRSDLLSCIVARIIGFLRVQQQREQQQSQPPATPTGGNNPEVEGVADAVNSDIAQKLAWAHEGSAPSPSSTSVVPPLDAETAAMYRVEILKFISRELPRALQDAVDKRLQPTQKKSLNRSLLALLVQKAQAALEHQMRATHAGSSPKGPAE